MIEKGEINTRQFTGLVMLFCLGSTILIVPSALTAIAKQDGWISAIVGFGLGLLLFFMINALGTRYPNQSLMEYSEVILGKWLGKAIGLSYISFYFILAALVLRNVGDFITTIVIRRHRSKSFMSSFLSWR
ncbi:GerAB/ArcD/ProY family transporter [Paenibacillus lignilyticus]|uniref:GerAB/ArcD/ProY family transporter n=1 Tax=Paenibacillus lignilyticus TaxID=1172615 RepID=A0ABS5CBQ7_9BACL|nr:GerAB/ArcD/ProY family transporter [Paenibacillus lignilyticus]